MFRLCLLALALFWPFGFAQADIPRPLDERATARMVVAALVEMAPEVVVKVSATTAMLSVAVPGKPGHSLRVDDIHAALRAEPDGSRRQEMLKTYVTQELALLGDLATGKQKRALDSLLEVESDTILPVLYTPNPAESWQLPANIHLPFMGGMVVFWVQDREVAGLRAGPISTHSARVLGLDKMKLRKIGLANLEARLDRVTEEHDGRFLTLSLDQRFGASLLLLDSYWQDKARDGQVLTAAIPRGDQLILIADATGAEIAELRLRAEAAFSQCKACKDSPLSLDLFRWTGAGWEILPP